MALIETLTGHELAKQVRSDLTAPWGTKIFDTEESVRLRLKDMDRNGIDIGVLTVTKAIDQWPETIAKKCAQAINDALGRICEKHRGRFVALAALPLQDMSAALEELDRAVNDVGLKGVGLFSSVGLKPLDDPCFFPLFERMERYELPIYIHPTGYGGVFKEKNGEAWENYVGNLVFGSPFQTNIAVHRLVFSGVLEKYPRLKVVAAHLGGMISFYPQRIDYFMPTLQNHISDKTPDKVLKDPHSYFKKVYYDTAVYNEPTLNCAYSYVGADHLLFATDYPFGPDMGDLVMRRSVELIENCNITAEEKQKITSKNARMLLKIA
jgi:predicted TIM-barrel fold metal-dependent hydrolase